MLPSSIVLAEFAVSDRDWHDELALAYMLIF
jgi:hypothetical protein